MTDRVDDTPEAGDGTVLTRHPVADFAVRLRGRLDELVTSPVPVWAMTPDDKRSALKDLAVAQAQIEALHLQVLAEADRAGDVAGPSDRTVADWVARETRQTRAGARADLRLARSLDEEHGAVAAGLATGTVRPDQARSIVRGLGLLPVRGEFAVDPAQRRRAEEHLVDLAAHHDAKALDVLARRIYSVVCPELADAYEGTLLEAEEARAARKVTFEMHEDHQGVCHGRFRIPRLHGQMLRKALHAIMSPLRPPSPVDGGDPHDDVSTSTGTTDRRPATVRLGEAFCELLERLRADDLPQTGGGDATVVVTIDADTLLDELHRAGIATLDTGGRISAAEARRLACRHRLLPAVLGGASQVLDLGRSRRFHSKAQRHAVAVRDGHCTAEHCDVPAYLCVVHHDIAWAEGGHTDLDNGRLVCGVHHRRIHDSVHRHETLPDGTLRFHRRE